MTESPHLHRNPNNVRLTLHQLPAADGPARFATAAAAARRVLALVADARSRAAAVAGTRLGYRSSMSSSDSDRPVGLLVVGGGPAGHSAAEAYRKTGGAGRVVIVSADEAPPYERPPLSKEFLRGESEEHSLPLESAEFYRDNQIELSLADPAVSLDLDGAAVETRSGQHIGYRSCVLATGCEPARLPVPGADDPRVLLLRSVASARPASVVHASHGPRVSPDASRYRRWSPSQIESSPIASARRAIARSSGQRTSRSTSGSWMPTPMGRPGRRGITRPR